MSQERIDHSWFLTTLDCRVPQEQKQQTNGKAIHNHYICLVCMFHQAYLGMSSSEEDGSRVRCYLVSIHM
jgi:hypothetical protein